MKMRTALLILTLTTLFAGCKKHETIEKDKIKMADWLLGSWEQTTNDGVLTESWEELNDSTFQGETFFINKKDTLHNEHMQLRQLGKMLTYNPTVIGQNNDKEVTFTLSTGDAKQLVFENAKHNFPTKITYKQITKDSMVAEISGMENGKPTSERYEMRRTK